MPPRSRCGVLLFAVPVRFRTGTGERRAEQLPGFAIRTPRDPLSQHPHRYVDASSVTPLARAEIGTEPACVGRVVAKGVLPTRRGLRIFHAVLRDESGLLECVWPGQAFLDRTIAVGQTLLVSGPVRFYHGRQMSPREYVILADADGGTGSPTAGKRRLASRATKAEAQPVNATAEKTGVANRAAEEPGGRDNGPDLLIAGKVLPVYPATEGL